MDRAQYQQPFVGTLGGREQALVNAFMRRVYNWMTAGLVLSALVAWFTMNSTAVLGMFINFETGAPTLLFWAALLAELGMVFGLSAGIRRMAVGTAMGLFIAYAALNGVTLGIILLAYTGSSVVKVFLITAGAFGATSAWAAATKRDLSGWGSFLFMGLIGIVIAMVVNMFLGSSMMDWIISVLGVGLFVGLTAYDTQQLRAMVLEAANETTVSKMAVIGALKLYLDFVNLFLMLLRLLGDRR